MVKALVVTVGSVVQPTFPVHYVIAGLQLNLTCDVIKDHRSPHQLRYRWLKDSTVISYQDERFIIIGGFNNLFINELDVTQHNGTYTCSVYEADVSRIVIQSTAVIIVEGM